MDKTLAQKGSLIQLFESDLLQMTDKLINTSRGIRTVEDLTAMQ